MIDWRHWHNEPLLTGGLIFLGWLYAILAGPLREWLAPGRAYPGRKAPLFYGSLVLFYLAVGSPLDQVGERFLLSAHMVQHQLIMYPAPLLFLLGIPDWMIDAFLGRFAPGSTAHRLLRFTFHPFVCCLFSAVIVSTWHAPLLYEWTLQQKTAHVAEHVMFFGVSLLFWWPLASPSRCFPPPGRGIQFFYVAGAEISMIPVSAYIIFSGDVLYPTYAYAPRLIDGFSPAADQLCAGLIMKFVGMAVSFAAFAFVFFRWHRDSATARTASPAYPSLPSR